MTYQQTPNAYPLVYEMKIVDNDEFTDIVVLDRNLLANSTTVAVTDDHNMYALTSTELGPGQLTKLSKQEFHEHYFVASDTMSYNGTPVQAKVKYLNEHLYVMSLGDSDIGMDRYTLVDGLPVLDWTTRYDGLGYNNDYLYGFSSDPDPSSSLCTWTYCYQDLLIMNRLDSNGVMDTSLSLDLGLAPGQDINGIAIEYLNHDAQPDAIFTYVTADGVIKAGHIASGVISSVVSVQSTASGPSAGLPVIRSDPDNAFICYIDRETGHICITTSLLPFHNSTTLSLPLRYTINREERFGEIHDPDQSNYGMVMTSNPLNPDFFYLAYFTSSGQVRVLKLYRHQEPASSQYLILWATKEGCFTDTGTGSDRRLNIVTDGCGDLYVFCRHQGGKLRMWKIREYLLDFGHDILSELATSVPASVFPDFLRSITDNYTMGDLDSPAINDVIVLDVGRVSGNYHVTFKYINYDIFQSPEQDETGMTISQQFNAELLEVLTTLYGSHNNVSIINFDGVFRIYDSYQPHTITVILPTSHLVKPCVVRGTEILVVNTLSKGIKTIPIEKIRPGDFVINQDGRPSKVLQHTKDIIIADSWTAPYIIPVGYFDQTAGQRQPYLPLLISGDHGIRMVRPDGSVGKLYPYTIKRGLKRIPIGSVVEYHHLVLESDLDFYIANGVLIEGLKKILVFKS